MTIAVDLGRKATKQTNKQTINNLPQLINPAQFSIDNLLQLTNPAQLFKKESSADDKSCPIFNIYSEKQLKDI